ncbi:monocarboxylate transporter 12-like [Lytechinus variegatus]|uniref:monocarboxylate transporter 12-like n=1 Tax=Lytechinus variegatus TaxID=7654 RepID=UPI001BB29D50|nr:monocarboxylate transporter 12-like [Lytechinus variegatus]
MAETLHEDSSDPWKYFILMSKSLLLFIDGGITKSFGVLIPDVVVRYDSDYKTAAFVLSLPSTIMYFAVPITMLLVKLTTPRTMGMVGGLLCALPIICAPWAPSIHILGIMLSVTGFGMALTLYPLLLYLNVYFSKSFIFSNALTFFGWTCGAFLIPIIVERSLEAYGYTGSFLILGGIASHSMVCGAVVRPPRDRRRHDCEKSTDDGEKDPLLLDTPTSEPVDKHGDQHHHQPGNVESETSKVLSAQLSGQNSQSYNEMKSSDGKSSWCSCASFTNKLKSVVFLQEPLYTLVAPATILQYFAMAGWMLFLVPHAVGAGIDRSNAVFLSTIAGISGIFGRILYLVLLHFDYDNTVIFCIACMISACTFFIDFVSSSYIFLAAMAGVQGVTLFILDSLPHAMMKLSIRNEENFPGALAATPFLGGAGIATGDYVSGYIYDVTSSFTTLFTLYGMLHVIITINLVIFKLISQQRRTSE